MTSKPTSDCMICCIRHGQLTLAKGDCHLSNKQYCASETQKRGLGITLAPFYTPYTQVRSFDLLILSSADTLPMARSVVPEVAEMQSSDRCRAGYVESQSLD